MTGLRGVIKARMPESWEYALKKHRIYEKYINGIYDSMGPKMKGRYGWKNGARNVEYLFRYGKIWEGVNQAILVERFNGVPWDKINVEIAEYENHHR